MQNVPISTPDLTPKPLSSSSCGIHSLPNELIIAILVFAIRIPEAIADQHTLSLNVQLVCKRWRVIGLHTRELWASLCIRTTDSSPRITEYSRRSGLLPLGVHIEADSDGSYLYSTGPPEWIRTIRANSDRIWKIHINIPNRVVDNLTTMLTDLPHVLPNILEFSVSSSYKTTLNSLQMNHWPRTLTMPSLRSLFLKDCAFTWWMSLTASCRDLVELRIIESHPGSIVLPLGELTALLHASLNLHILELGMQLLAPASHHTTPIVTKNLRTLIIRNYTSTTLGLLFKIIKAPQLKTLLIWGDSGDRMSEDGPAPLLEFLPPETLTLENTPSALWIAKLLSASVKHLQLFQEEEGDKLLYALQKHWKSCTQTVHIQTLTTRGISANALSEIHDKQYAQKFLPSLQIISAPDLCIDWDLRQV